MNTIILQLEDVLLRLYPYALPPLVTGIIISVLAIYLMTRAGRSRLVRAISLFCTGLVIWQISAAIVLLSADAATVAVFKALYFIGWLAIPSLFFFFVIVFCSLNRLYTLPFALISLLLIIMILWGDRSFIQLNYFGSYPKLSFPFSLYVDVYYFMTSGIGLFLLFREFSRSQDSIRRHQARLLWLGTTIGFLISISETIYMTAETPLYRQHSLSSEMLITNYGLHIFVAGIFLIYLLLHRLSSESLSPWAQPFQNLSFMVVLMFMGGCLFAFIAFQKCFPLYPISSVGLIIAMVMISYAVLKYRFMDMGEFVRRFIVNIFLSIFFIIFYIGLIAWLSPETRDLFPVELFVIVLVVLLHPLQVRLQRFVQTFFFSQRHNYQKMIKDVSDKVVTVMERRKLVDIVQKTIVSTLNVYTFALYLYDDKSETYQPLSLYGLDDEVELKLSSHDPLISLLKASPGGLFREELRLIDGAMDHLKLFDALKTVLIIPMFLKGFLRGLLCLGDKRSGDIFTTTDIELLQILCNQTVIALDNARLYELAITDELTRLYIVRYFHQKCREEIITAGRLKQPLSLFMLDLDHFKSVNDTHGHQTGDDVLKTVASLIKEQVRVSDVVARYGGEEITVLLPDTDNEKAVQVAERIRTIIGGHGFTQSVRQFVSIGVATLQGDLLEPILSDPDLRHLPSIRNRLIDRLKSLLIHKADDFLYQAKQNGRNRTENAGILPFDELMKAMNEELQELRADQ